MEESGGWEEFGRWEESGGWEAGEGSRRLDEAPGGSTLKALDTEFWRDPRRFQGLFGPVGAAVAVAVAVSVAVVVRRSSSSSPSFVVVFTW